MTSDEELLARLAEALLPDEEIAPSADLVAALHRSINSASPSPSRGRRRGGLALAIVAALGSVGVPAAAFAVTGAPLPSPLRSVAHLIGLPLDSNELADARADRNHLRTALARHDDRAVADALAHLRDDVAHLAPGERAELEPELSSLLAAGAARVSKSGAKPEAGDLDSSTTSSASSSRVSEEQSTESGSSEEVPTSSSPETSALSSTVEPQETTTTATTAPAIAVAPASDSIDSN